MPRRGALLLLGFVPAGAPRSPGPCSEWFDNAWLKSRGYNADVCCWRNHPDCWLDGYSYASCCGDYDTREYEAALASIGHDTQERALPAIALPLGHADAGSPLDGRVPPPPLGLAASPPSGGGDEGDTDLSAPEYASPRDFLRALVPAARSVLQAEEAALSEYVNTTTAAKAGGTAGTSLVLFIMTAPGNFARRAAIRRTWLQTALEPGAAGTRFAFVIGAPDVSTRTRIPLIARELRDEQAAFADTLVLSSLQDVYWGWEHTAKTFLALIAVLARAPAATHFACLHDDVYVNVPRLVSMIAELAGTAGGVEDGWYIGNAYLGHDFVGHSDEDGPAYEAMHGHRKMPPIMKGGLWVVDRVVAHWVAAMLGGPATLLPWRLWPSDDDSVGLVFGELDLRREHALRHGAEWFDWRLGDRCDPELLVVAHDLKTPRELFEIWARHVALGNPCHGLEDGVVRKTSRPEDFTGSA